MEKVTLQTLKSGAVIDLFNVEFEKMLANINDENTSPTTSRSITIKIEVKPGKNTQRRRVPHFGIKSPRPDKTGRKHPLS